MSFLPPIQECIQDASGYEGRAQCVVKKARVGVEVASDQVQNSRLEALASVAEKFISLRSRLEDIMEGLKKKTALDTAIQDFCHAIVKIAAYLADVAKLLCVVQNFRKEEFYADRAVGLVETHFTKKRTIQLMEGENNKMIKTLHKKIQGSAANDPSGSAANDPSDDKTQLGDCDAIPDKLATIYDELQNTIEEGQKLDMQATRHVLTWAIQAVEEVNAYRAKHGLSLYLLVEDMFIKAMDERYARGWIDDLKQDLQNIAGSGIRVDTVMDMVSTLQKACGDGQLEESQPYSPAES